MIKRNGFYYDDEGKRIYPNATQIKALEETVEGVDVQSPTPVEENLTESPTETPKTIPATPKPPVKRTYKPKPK